MQGERESRQKAEKIRAFHLVVEGSRLPMYWMHLQVAVDTTLATLDHFLRDTWLECCGHLSVFRIGGLNYYVDAGQDAYWWDRRRKTMQVKLEEVLSPGQTCSYEKDFGSTTELLLKVIAEYEVEMKGRLSRPLPGIACRSFLAMCAENPLPASVLNASMKIKGVCVMCVRGATHVVKRCSCHWSIHREPGYVGIRVRTRRLAGSQSLRYLTNRHIIYIILSREQDSTR